MSEPTKLCWQCGSEIPLQAKVCKQCKVRVASMGEDGVAKRSDVPAGCWWTLAGAVILMLAIPIISQFVASLQDGQRTSEITIRLALEEKKKQIRFSAMSAPEYMKAAAAALAGRRTNDIRPELLLSGQKESERKEPISDSQWEEARRGLLLIKEDQPEFSKAQQMLKVMVASDKKKAIQDAKKKAAADLKARKVYGPILEQRMIQLRINADVEVYGKDSTCLLIRWILASKVTANDLGKSGVLEEAERLGFKEVRYTDGHGFTCYWTL